MKRRITDLFKSMFSKTKKLFQTKSNSKETEVATIEKSNMFHRRKSPPSRHIIAHNQRQAQHAKKVQKRRKANKVARAQRKVNRKAA